MSKQTEFFPVYLEYTDWFLWGYRLGVRVRLYQDYPTGNENFDRYLTFWSIHLPLGLELAIHPPSKLTNYLRRIFS